MTGDPPSSDPKHDCAPGPDRDQERGAVQIVDAIMGFVVLVALLVTAPQIYNFLDMVTAVADPFSATLMQLFVPFLFLAILISVGVSARRGGG